MNELDELRAILPVRILDALYESEVLTLHGEREVLISIRCPFVVEHMRRAEFFPGGEEPILRKLEGLHLSEISIEATGPYPDLLLQFGEGARLSTRAPHAGEEMWFIDVQDVTFISP